jgi:hypothetical protein
MKYQIYRLLSPSGKSYIGQTRQEEGVEIRFKQHLALWEKWKVAGQPRAGYQPKLFYAFNKHSPQTFIKEILAETDDPTQINDLEKRFITQFNSVSNGYNTQLGGQEGWANLNLSEDHKLAIGEARKQFFQSEEGRLWKEQLRERFRTNNPSKKGREAWNKGIKNPEHSARLKGIPTPLTEEGRQRQTENMKRRWARGDFANRPPMTEEHRRKIGEKAKGRPTSVLQKEAASKTHQRMFLITFPDGSQETITNLTEFAKKYNLGRSNMRSPSGSKGFKAKQIEQ